MSTTKDAQFGLQAKTTFLWGSLIYIVVLITAFTAYWQAKSLAELNACK